MAHVYCGMFLRCSFFLGVTGTVHAVYSFSRQCTFNFPRSASHFPAAYSIVPTCTWSRVTAKGVVTFSASSEDPRQFDKTWLVTLEPLGTPLNRVWVEQNGKKKFERPWWDTEIPNKVQSTISRTLDYIDSDFWEPQILVNKEREKKKREYCLNVW